MTFGQPASGLALLCFVPVLAAADWPQWRGTSSLGISSETGLPTHWSSTRNIAWKTALAGTGTSSPIVAGNMVIVTSQLGAYATGDGADPRLARDDAHLADDLAAAHLADRLQHFLAVPHVRTQPPAEDEVHGVARLTLFHESDARRDGDPFEARAELGERRRLDVSQEGSQVTVEEFVLVRKEHEGEKPRERDCRWLRRI